MKGRRSLSEVVLDVERVPFLELFWDLLPDLKVLFSLKLEE